MLIALLLLNGCFDVEIKSDIDYPEGLFKKTMKKIEAIHAKDPDRKGKVSNIHFLVYSGEDRELIKFSVSMAMAKMCSKEKLDTKKLSGKKIHLDLENINVNSLDNVGPGLLIQVEESENNTHVIIWVD
jgi:hypothetical protein